VQDMPASEAWVVTAGFAQLGVVVGMVREGRGRSKGAEFGARLVTRNIVRGRRLVCDDCWVGYWIELAGGFGARGGAVRGTYCGVPSHGGSGSSCRCGRLLSMVRRVGWYGAGVLIDSTNVGQQSVGEDCRVGYWIDFSDGFGSGGSAVRGMYCGVLSR